MSITAETLKQRIDVKIVEEHLNEKRRGHLGASQIGNKCYRYLWHVLHWSYKEKFSAKQLRLFARGNLEEQRFLDWLKPICEELYPVNPKTGKQWRVSDFNGIFSGSCDGVAKIDGLWYLLEFKTHGDKSFKEFAKHKVKACKPVHYDQIQVYLRKLNLPRCVYMAINKNTDELYIEIIERDDLSADIILDRAKTVVEAESGLDMPRISESPVWWECKMCAFTHICNKGAAPDKNCRTCAYSKPKSDKTWYCTRHLVDLSIEEQQVMVVEGIPCTEYKPADVYPQKDNGHAVSFSL